MRLLLTFLLLTTAFAGCLGGSDDGAGDTPAQGGSDDTDEMPDRRFEPKLIMETEFLELEQGDNITIELDMTDLHDYRFPRTFLDWNLTYSRAPTPVMEGDATQLPVTYTRTLHAEDWHIFTFSIADGQGYRDSKSLLIKAGDPPPLKVDLDDIELPETDEVQVFEFAGSTSLPCAGAVSCWYVGADGCVGWVEGTNEADCVWFNITSEDDPAGESKWGGAYVSDGPDDVDVEFRSGCSPTSTELGFDAAVGHDEGIIPMFTQCVILTDALASGGFSLTITVDTPYDGDPWVDVDVDGVCHAVTGVYVVDSEAEGEDQPGETKTIEYIHDRTPPQGVPFNDGGGVWWYQESNGIPGLQVGGEFEAADYQGCSNPDVLIF